MFQRLIEGYNSFTDSASEVNVPLFSNQQSSHDLSLTPQLHQASPHLSFISSQKATLNEASASQGIIVQHENSKSEMQLSSSSQATSSQRSMKDANTTTKHRSRRVSCSKVGPSADYQQPPTTSPKQQYLENWPSLNASLKCSVKTPKYVPSVSNYVNPEYSRSQKRKKVSMSLFINDKFKKALQTKTKSTKSKNSTAEGN